jgi:hypothetical protein
MNKPFLKNNWDLILILVLYSLLAIFSLKYFPSTDADGISYINIAHEYVMGEWGYAINGIWSPLYSWLMTPFFLFGFTPTYGVYVSKIVSLIIGFFTIISIKMLTRTFKIDKIVERALLFSLVPVILVFALVVNTPDLLLACTLIIYSSIIFSPNYPSNIINSILCGFIGALAYLSKSYAFLFFVIHFILFNIIFYLKNLNDKKKKNIFKNLILGLSIFFIISGIWTSTISEKYGKITISTAGEYNHDLVGLEYTSDPTRYINYLVYRDGLLKPPNKLTSIWDDPSYIKMKHWSPFDSLNSFKHQMIILGENIFNTIHLIEIFFPITGILMISILFFIGRSKSQKASKDKLIYLLATMFIYTIGYCFIFVLWRYLLFTFILIMIAGFYLVDSMYKSKMITKTLKNILLIILVFSFIIQPINSGIAISSNDNSAYTISNTLKNDYNVHGNIASNLNEFNSISISYYLNSKYYGLTNETKNLVDLQKELEYNNIDYYFVWDNMNITNLSGYEEITNGKIKGLNIYSKIKFTKNRCY